MQNNFYIQLSIDWFPLSVLYFSTQLSYTESRINKIFRENLEWKIFEKNESRKFPWKMRVENFPEKLE